MTSLDLRDEAVLDAWCDCGEGKRIKRQLGEHPLAQWAMDLGFRAKEYRDEPRVR